MSKDIVPQEVLESKILLIRGHRVILDRHLAELYGVEPRRLNEQVKRKIKRFPADFMFQLTNAEAAGLSRSQLAPVQSLKAFLGSAAGFYGTWGGHVGRGFE